MTALVQWSLRHDRVVLGIATALAFIACVTAPNLRVQLDARSLLPAQDGALVESDAAASIFNARDTIVLAVSPAEGSSFTGAALERLAWVTDQVRLWPGIEQDSVVSLATLPRLRLTSSGLSIGGTLLPRSRTSSPREVELIRADVRSGGAPMALLVAGDERSAAVVAEVRPDADRFDLLDRARELSRQMLPAYRVHITGSALCQAELGRTTASDLAVLLPITLVVVGVGLWWTLGRWSRAVACLLEIGFSLICTIGLMGAIGEKVFVSTLILPVVLIVVGVSDDVYALKRFVVERRSREVHRAILAGFGHVAGAIGTTTICTVVGLMSLTLSGVNPLRVLGLYGSVAIGLSYLCTFTLVPALLVQSETTGTREQPKRSSIAWAMRWSLMPHRAGVRLIVVATVMAGLAVASVGLRVNDSWVSNLPADSDLVDGERFFSTAFSGTMRLEMLIDGGKPGAVFEQKFLTSVGTFERAVASASGVGAVLGPYGMAEPAARLLASSPGQAASSVDVAGALSLLEASAPGVLSQAADNTRRYARVTAVLRAPDYASIQLTIEQIREAIPQMLSGGATAVSFFGDGWLSYRTVRSLVSGQTVALPIAIATDWIVLTILFRSTRAAAAAIWPVVASVVGIAAALALTGVPLGVANSMSAAIVFGIGVDFSIHFMSAAIEQQRSGRELLQGVARALSTTAPSILAGAVSLTFGFAVLAVAKSVPTRQLGLVTALALMGCAVFTLTALPAVWLCLGRSPVRADPRLSRGRANHDDRARP